MQRERAVFLIFITILALSGCGTVPPSEEESVVTSEESDSVSYGLTMVTREDVVLSARVIATYVQAREQEVSFDSGGRRISRVYVEPGDRVEMGDLLLELEDDGIQEEIDELEYRIARNELLLSDLDEAERLEEQGLYAGFVYGDNDIDEDDVAGYEEDKEELARQYRYRREDYQDELEFDRRRLAAAKKRLSESYVRSTLDGAVIRVLDSLKGHTTRKDEVVMTIADDSSGHFETKAPEYAPYFHEGVPVGLKIVYSSALGEYELMPYDMSDWGETQLFEIYSGPDNEGIDVGTTGTIVLELDKRSSVLSLPIGAIYYADDTPYVYTLDENDLRQITWIETGLKGDSRVEIISGLSEGDKVVYH